MWASLFALCAFAAVALSGCVSTDVAGYADRTPPSRPIQRIAAAVSAPSSIAGAVQGSVASTASGYGIAAGDALALLPPTRQYSDAEVKQTLTASGVDAVLLVSLGDSGVQRQYAGTILSGTYSGSTTGSLIGNSISLQTTGTSYVDATPTYRYSRLTTFQAKLVEVATGRTLWVGSGQVQADGRLFTLSGVSGSQVAEAIFKDLAAKGLARPVS